MAVERKPIGRPRAHGNASAAARWLRDRFDRLAPRLSVRRPDFGAVLAEMAKAGITHGGGDPPAPLTEATVRKMWRRVRLDLCAGTAAPTQTAPEGVAPRRREVAPAGWKPAIAASGPEGGGGGSDYLAALRADIGKRSGRR